MMPTAVIADDEYLQRQELRRMLSIAWPELEILEECEDGSDALDAIVNRFAGSLSQRGVRQGDRVAVYLGNCMEAIVSVLGIARLGAVLVTRACSGRAPSTSRGDRRPLRPTC